MNGSHEGKKRHVHGGFSTQGSYDVKKILELMKLKEGFHVLDAGCGDGYISILMSREVGPRGRIYAFDSHPASIGILKTRLEHMKIGNVVAETRNLADELPIEDGSLDMVFMSNVLHGLILNGEMEGFVKSVRNKLKQGAIFAVVEFRKENTGIGPDISERFDPGELEDYLGKLNLRLLSAGDISPHHYLALFGNADTS